jgi:dienelactone hydrolase
MSRRPQGPIPFVMTAVLVLAGCGASSSPPPAASPSATSPSVALPPAATSAATTAPSGASAIQGVITVDPPEVPIDEPVSIRLSGFPPNHEVTIHATTVGGPYDVTSATGVRASDATFMTDATGAVDLATQAPLRGSYGIANAMGLFWSVADVPRAPDASPVPSAATPAGPVGFVQFRYELTAEVDGSQAAIATVTQDLGSPGITATDVAEGGIVGQFYVPSGAGPFPAVIVLSGSSGGLATRKPKVLAAHGYAVLSLPYFNYTSPLTGSSLPGDTSELPLEYFGKAITWLQSQPAVDPSRIGIYGGSLGGEVGMLVAAHYPEIKAVIAVAPPAVTWDDGAGRSSFSFNGKGVPFVVPFGLEALAQPFRDAVSTGKDFRATIPGIVAKIKADPEMAAAIVPAEKIRGSVLLLSGTDDTQGPGVIYSELVVDRLKAAKFAFPYRHMIGAGAGHLLEFPFVDRTIEISQGGGSPEANELAGEAMWPVVLQYLAAMK